MMLGGELDFLCLVPDDVGDPGVGVAVVPAEPDRDQQHQQPPQEEQFPDERVECLLARPALVGGEAAGAAAAAEAGLADVEVARVGPQVAPPLREHADEGAHRLPRLEVRQDPEEDLVPEAAEAVAAAVTASGRPPPRRCVFREHFFEQVTCTEHRDRREHLRSQNQELCSVREEPRNANGSWHSPSWKRNHIQGEDEDDDATQEKPRTDGPGNGGGGKKN